MKLRFKSLLSFALTFCLLLSGIVFASDEPAPMKKAKRPVTINVGKDENFKFHSIQEALDSVKEEPTVYSPLTIVINEGVYEEEVHVKLPYVIFKAPDGKNARNVVITYDKANGHVDDATKAKGTQDSATVTLEKTAVGFRAERITFENSYNIGDKNAHRPQSQAVALVSMTDKVVFDNCRFLGRQDTLYLKGASKGKTVFGDANKARVFIKDSYIEGTVDYIFGDATAFFQNCHLHMTYRENGGHYTAANTTLSNVGYIFYKCTLTADPQYGSEPNKVVDLGRPWQGDSAYPYYGSHTAFIECVMPDCLNTKGFVPWNDSTIKSKIRYMEYGSVDSKGNPIDLSSIRDDFVQILTDEQAKNYSEFSAFEGWSPYSDIKYDGNIDVLSITLDKYSLSIPKDSSDTIKALILPIEAENKNIIWSVEDTNIASVDENGNITGVSEGKTTVTAKSEQSGFEVTADIAITAPKTSIPTIEDINIKSNESSNIITLDYSYNLKSDNSIDNALIKWCAIDTDGNEYVLTQGRGKNFKSYTPEICDIGYRIKAYVYPETITTYGESGNPVSAETSDFIVSDTENGLSNGSYFRDNFSDISKNWDTDNNLIIYKKGENEKDWSNASYIFRMRFDPEKEGISSSDSFDIYTAYKGKDKSYYRLNFKRGSNTDSLKVYLYKKEEKSEEVLIASDEESLSKKIPQARGEENPYFIVNQKIINGNISVDFNIEGEENPVMTLKYNDTTPLSGFVAFESTSEAVLKTTLTVSKVQNTSFLAKENDIIKIVLAGDSTVKSYGNDNTIGGWGEYLQYYFDSDHVKIINKAEGGRSTRSYLNQGRLADAVSDIGEGDYLFIQFGHNDARTDENAFLEHSVPLGEPDEDGIYPTNSGVKSKTPDGIYNFYKDMPYSETFYSYESGGTFKWFLKQYVEEARKVGATPVLITPVSRVFFDKDGKITPHHGTDDGYVKAVLQVADEMDVACVDMFSITKNMYENYGVRVTQGLQNIKSDGSMDITHYNKFGSNIVTSKLIEALRKAGIYACVYSKNSDKTVEKTEDLKNAMVYIVGGSCAAGGNNEQYLINKEGWGNYLQKYFSDQISVLNMAVDGKSSKSYIQEKNYKNVFANIAEGDYILIQFGTDDIDKNNEQNYTQPGGNKESEGSFKYYLYNYYIKPALDKKAVPIVISPCAQSSFGSDQKAENIYSEYINDIKELVTEAGAYYINLNDVMLESYNTYGEKTSDLYHAVYKNNSSGKNGIDIISLNRFGAVKTAKTILNLFGFSSATLKDYINTELTEEEYIEKGEFITDLMMLFDDDIVYQGNNFSDISDGKTYTEAVGKAKQIGIIIGDSDNLFRPEDDITVNEIKTIIESFLDIKNKRQNFDFKLFDSIQEDKITIEQESYILYNVREAIYS